MKTRKKVYILILSALMILSMMPFSVFADAHTDSSTDGTPNTAVSEDEQSKSDDGQSSDSLDVDQKSVTDDGAKAKSADDKEEVTENENADKTKSSDDAKEQTTEEKNDAEDGEKDKTSTSDIVPFTGKAGGVEVNVEAPKTAFPEGTTMEVTKVDDKDVYKAIDDTMDGEVKTVKAVDITFRNTDGIEIQPTATIKVTLKSSAVAEAQCPVVVHVDKDEDGNFVGEKVDRFAADPGKEEVTFEAKKFSVYAVVEGSTAAEGRATLNFYGKDGLVATVYVKNGDTAADLEKIIYDPGAGILAEGDLFRGWNISTKNTEDGQEYTTDTDGKSIEDVRSFFESVDIKEGDVYNIYAMIFKAYSVQYKDEDGVTVHSETLINKTGEAVTYTVDFPYTPKNQDSQFQGWSVSSSSSDKIDPAPGEMTDQRYPNGTEVEISGHVTFQADPAEGFWLIFNENGKGASYVPPQFIEDGKHPTNPADPTRLGYTFDGWYTGAPATEGGDPTGTKVTDVSSLTLTQRTTLYAKWKVDDSANYTVIIWKQNLDGDGYDFGESIKLSGTPNTTINTVTRQGTGDNAYARINGTNKQYAGFHLDNFDQNVTISPEGNTVLNVYYDRNEYTFTFQDYGYTYTPTTGNNGTQYGIVDGEYVQLSRHNAGTYYNPSYYWTYGDSYWSEGPRYTGTRYTRSNNQSWQTIHTVTALYQQDISDIWSFTGTNGKSYPQIDPVTSWTPQNSSTYTARITRMETMPAENITFRHTTTDNTTRYFHYYVEAVDGSTGTRTYDGRQYSLYTDLPNDFNIVYYNDDFWNLNGFTRQAITKSNNQVVNLNPNGTINWTTLNNNYGGTDNHLYFYYTRNKYKINYMDGVYVDGDGSPIEETDHGHWGTSEDIYYQADISSYNKGGSDYYEPTRDGYVFEGWYINKDCTQPYTFTKMPEDGVTVYAKWVQKQYRVFMHPNVDRTDTSLDWGDQDMSFRVDYGEKIAGGSDVTGTRDDYELIGWYTDPECTKSFNFDAFELNDTTVTTPYDKTEPTELDKYGNPTSSENRDAVRNRFWIDKKLDLYAKWRAKLDGAKGINVVYSADDTDIPMDGTNAPTDPLDYLDSSEAVAGAASTPSDSDYQFLHWVVQKWDGEKYVDTETIVYPGDTFTVLKANAHRTNNPDSTGEKDKYLYTVQLRAAYGPKEAPTPTHITWYDNFTENPKEGTNYITDSDLQINEAVLIEPADRFTRPGYKFLGWAQVPTTNSEGQDLPGYKLEPRNLGENDVYLKYHEAADGVQAHFTAVGADGNTHTVSQVAADETFPYHDMYAVWEPITYTVVIRKHITGDYSDTTKSFTYTPSATLDSTQAKFTLTDYDKSKTEKKYEDLVYGTKVNVTEAQKDYTKTVTVTKFSDPDMKNQVGAPQTITDGSDITVDNYVLIEYNNTLEVIITGIKEHGGMIALLVVGIAAAAGAFMMQRHSRRRRHANADDAIQ